ncbi:MAG: aminoglycoside phosphotransferase family protein [Acidimicrobiales bacterium]
MEAEWSITCGAPFDGGNAAYVAEALTHQGATAVLKVALPAPGVDGFSPFEQELETLLLARGDPYVAVLRHDTERRSVLLERLGKPLASLGWPIGRQIEALASTLARGWRPVTTDRLPTGAAKANWLAEFVTTAWSDLGRPCSASAVEQAAAFAAERAARFELEGAVLVHADGHAHNLLTVQDSEDKPGFRLTDPEGLVSEPAHDLGVVLRGWNEELLLGSTAEVALERCEEVASLCGIDAEAIWQWAFIERVSTGLFLLRLGHHAEAAAYLAVADRLAEGASPPMTPGATAGHRRPVADRPAGLAGVVCHAGERASTSTSWPWRSPLACRWVRKTLRFFLLERLLRQPGGSSSLKNLRGGPGNHEAAHCHLRACRRRPSSLAGSPDGHCHQSWPRLGWWWRRRVWRCHQVFTILCTSL